MSHFIITGSGGGGGGSVQTLTGNDLVIVSPDGSGNINVVGDGSLLTVTGTANTETITLVPGTDGQLIIGSSIGVPIWASLTAGTGITITPGHNSISIASSAISSISITGDTGGALIGAAFTFTGGTTGLSFGGAGSTETLSGTLAVKNGGTGNTTFTAYSVITAGTTATGAFQNVVGLGSSGNVLTSAGAGALPAWAAPAASSISITGNTGGALTGAAFTFSGGTTGLSFGGAGSTETLSGTLVVSNGGSGAATLTGVLTGNGTSAFTVSALTQHYVLVGAASNLITSVSPSTSGFVLTSNGVAADPSFAAPAASSISITGNSGGALTGAAFTFTGGTTGLTFAGAGSTETLGGTLVVSNGGTGNTTFTAYSLIAAGTTATGVFQNVVGLGSSGNVLTSAGAGALPAWAAPAASSISITGNSGGALTGAAFTFTGGTTGLTFSGAGSTETLTGTLVVSNGGTGLATMTTPYAVICAGTTATGVLQPLSALGASGTVLTSNGAGALPSFQAAASGGITWSVITANQTAAVNNGYICNKGSNLALALPTTAAAGTVIQVAGMNTALGWSITQASGQQIHFGAVNTTSGAGGSLSSSAIYDSVSLVCSVANNEWIVWAAQGNLTYV